MADTYLRFWGVRGSYASPFASHMKVGGNTSCVEVRTPEHILVCDAGTGIIPLGYELAEQDKFRELLIIMTHYHWDHICGLPFFSPAFMKDWTIGFLGPGQSIDEVKKYLGYQMQNPYFPVSIESYSANIRYLHPVKARFKYGPFSIQHYNVHHPGTTYGYRIFLGGKTIVYIPDNECYYMDKSLKERKDEFTSEEHTLFQAIHKEEHAAALSLIENADILIHDAQYTEEDYANKKGWGHSCYKDTINSAIDANVKSLYLYHHDPRYDDKIINQLYVESQKLIKQRNSDIECHIACEGMQIDLDK